MIVDKKIPLIVIAGPTASGKTKLAVELAKIYDGEVISADSMQIYKEMTIASAKPTVEEMQEIPHHLIDILEPDYPFSVAEYVKMANDAILDVYSRKKTPILCGGTGLYISSLIDNVQFDETGGDNSIRERLTGIAKEQGNHALWEMLYEIDPETAEKVHENNLSRVIRGIEYFEQTGVKLSQQKTLSRREKSPYDACIIGLTFSDRAMLYDRINKRVDVMIENGLLDEARNMFENFTTATSRQAIGYKELIPFFENTASIDECIDKIKLETRHYAKRQLTWFRRIDGIKWVELDKYDEYKKIIEKVKNIIAKSKVLCYNIS